MKKEQRKVLQELLKKPRVPRAIREKHGDIEDAIEASGGKRGSLRHASA
jgi:uncharacterized protein (UPF0147 family)